MNPGSRCFSLLLLVAVATISRPLRSEQVDDHTRTHPTRAIPHRQTILGLPNFAQVSPTLYRGGQPTAAGFRKLADMGVNVVVDLRLTGRDQEKSEVKKLGMSYVALPWHCMVPRDDVFSRFLKIFTANPEKKVFVHCRYGDDRTGMMVAAYRLAVEGWTEEEARREMDRFGFHPLLCSSLVGYERTFPERLNKDAAVHPAPAISDRAISDRAKK